MNYYNEKKKNKAEKNFLFTWKYLKLIKLNIIYVYVLTVKLKIFTNIS